MLTNLSEWPTSSVDTIHTSAIPPKKTKPQMTVRAKRSTAKVQELAPSSPFSPQPLDVERLRRRGIAAKKARETPDKHTYFAGVAEARYVLRKVFRIVEEQAKKFGIDPLAHQALIQVYGSAEMQLQVNQIANRLDITPAFASSLVRILVDKGLVERRRDDRDQRVTYVAITEKGREVMDSIDENVKFHVDYFVGQITPQEREGALSVLMFYVGAKI
jgi:DNA-binding MarR family transcriptional regulator